MRIKSLFLIALLSIIGCSGIPAQEAFVQAVPFPGADGKAASIPSGAILESNPVKNAPFSAEAVNEIVMLLADGNRIVNNAITKIYRDSEGRTRREILADNPRYVTPIESTLPFQAQIRFESGIRISDPVSWTVYSLDPKTHTAKKEKMMTMQFVKPTEIPAALPVRGEGIIAVQTNQSSPAGMEYESLGKKVIEGVECDGRLIKTTIPAGQVGNEKPIVLTDERWYSPKLRVDVLSKRYDPRSGENTYKLVNLSQSEPAASLFQVPLDYKLIDVSEEDKNTNRVLRPFSELNPNPGSPVISRKNSEEAASVCADLASSSSKATLTERIEDYYLSAQCYQKTGQVNDAMLIYAKAEILGKQIAGNATAAKAREILDQLYRSIHNNSVLGIEKIYRKAEESLSQSEK